MLPTPNRGEIWLANLDAEGNPDQPGTRPVLIISANAFNHGPAGMVFVLPVTRMDKGIPLHVMIDPPEGGVPARSYIVCDALRTIGRDRLGPGPWGRVTPATLTRVEDMLRVLIEL